MVDYFKNEIEQNDMLAAQLTQNVTNFQNILIEGVNSIKQNL